MQKQYDVIIAGGGLAGLTLSIQLKKANPDISILIMEYRDTIAPIAAHKVGESTVELATHYFREVLELKDYLEEFELPKHGLRFFFNDGNKEELSNRVELGPRLKLPVPSHQLDRGTFENFLEKHTKTFGTEFMLGARVKDVVFSSEGHEVVYNHDGEEKRLKAKWVVDATSRFSLLKRKLKFEKKAPHDVNAVWYRVKGVVDIDEWSDNEKWKTFLAPKLRYLSTVHLIDKGYWLWIIPLGSKNTSIGIVADQDIHPFDTINTYEKAVAWIKKNEPQAYKHVCPPENELLDFRILRHFAHDSERIYSSERWAVTGEAGVFLDPFYSPGSDFISLNNTWLSDLILRDISGEDITVRAQIYEQTHLRWFESWLPIYQDKYKLMGSSQIMVMKIFWDWAIYWSVPCLLFTNKGFTDLKVLKELFVSEDSIGRKFQMLNKCMQDLFLEWLPHENKVFENKYIDPLDLGYLKQFQQGIENQHSTKELLDRVKSNVKMLEQVAAEVFRLVSNEVKGTPVDMKVNPYTITLNGTVDTTSENALPVDNSIAMDVKDVVLQNRIGLILKSKMKKEELPQDDSALKVMTRELCYVKDNDGKYTTGLSTGWDVKKQALDNAWEDINERVEEARKLVRSGEKSPIYYFMELRLMDMPVLSGYTGFWSFTIKRHMKPDVFKNLSDKKLAIYAKAFEVSVDELKNFKG